MRSALGGQKFDSSKGYSIGFVVDSESGAGLDGPRYV